MPHPKKGTRTRGQARGCLSLRKHLPEPVYPPMGRARIRTVSSSIETIGRDCSEAFHAAYRIACRTSSSSNSGYAPSTSSMLAPPAIILRTTPTVIRIPRMVGCPRHTAGSISIRSRGGIHRSQGNRRSHIIIVFCGIRSRLDRFAAPKEVAARYTFRTTCAGVPATTVRGGTSCVTTAPAPTTAPSPTVTSEQVPPCPQTRRPRPRWPQRSWR